MILLIGSRGQLGSEVLKCLADSTVREIAGPDGPSLEGEMALNPVVVINCAAYTNVDGAEIQLALAGNTTLPERLVAAANGSTTLLHFCTDYVYDGSSSKPYTEADVPAPLNIYGATKLAGSQAILKYPKSYVVRTSGVFTLTNPSSFVSKIMTAARRNGKISVVEDQMVCPTFAPLLARASMELVASRGEYGLYNYCSSPVSWHEFARYALELAGIKATVEAISTKEYLSRNNKPNARPIALRPAYSCLDTSKIKRVLSPDLADSICWRTHLEAAFDQRGHLPWLSP